MRYKENAAEEDNLQIVYLAKLFCSMVYLITVPEIINKNLESYDTLKKETLKQELQLKKVHSPSVSACLVQYFSWQSLGMCLVNKCILLSALFKNYI